MKLNFLIVLTSLICYFKLIECLPSVEEVCKNDVKDINLGWSNIEDVQNLIQQFKSKPEVCDKRFHNSFLELEKVLNQNLLDDICGFEMYNEITEYHLRFISYYLPQADKHQLNQRETNGLEPIPKSLQDFFIVFVDSISSKCKKYLHQQLENEFNSKIDDKEFELINRIKDESEKVIGKDYYEEPKKIDDVLIDPSKNSIMETNEENKLYIHVRFNDILKKTKDLCEKKFKPIYDELFVPVIRLNNLGYSDKLEAYVENFKFRFNKKFTRWFSIIQTCEVLQDIEVIQDPSSISAAADLIVTNDLKDEKKSRRPIKKVNILNKNEAVKLRQEINENIEKHSSVANLAFEVNEIRVEHSKLKFGSLLITAKPKERLYLVDRFNKKIKKYLRHKTNNLSIFAHKLDHMMKSTIKKWSSKVIDEEETSAITKVFDFMEHHKAYMGCSSILIALIFVIP